jgi:hypothetical protein
LRENHSIIYCSSSEHFPSGFNHGGIEQKKMTTRTGCSAEDDHLLDKKTPAEIGALPKNEHGDPPQAMYNYANVVGMLQ